MSKQGVRRIVVCADDFGLTDAASRAIVELMSLGAISATSCVVDGEHCAPWREALLQASRGRSIGLHLNLTEGPAALRMDLRRWLLSTFVRRADEASLRIEIDRQLTAFENLFIRPPDFIDGHEHVHQFAVIREALVERMSRRYGQNVALRSTLAQHWRGSKAWVIERLGAPALRRLTTSAGFTSNRDFAGVYDFSLQRPYQVRMHDWLRTIEDGGLVMCHPEFDASGAAPPARFAEHQFLASPAWPAMRERMRIELTPFTAAFCAAPRLEPSLA